MDPEDIFSQIQASSIMYRFATGPNQGKRALVLKTISSKEEIPTKKGIVVESSGFSLHAGVSVGGSERQKLGKLARYIARPPMAQDRLHLNEKGQVIYELKKPYRDGTSHIVMSPLELLEKIAAIIPRPRGHLTRYHGVLAPHYKYRELIVPAVKVEDPPKDNELIKIKPQRTTWVKLLQRVFSIDVEVCKLCGGKVKIVAVIEKPSVIQKILDHIGMPSLPPEVTLARGPPIWNNNDEDDFNQTLNLMPENTFS